VSEVEATDEELAGLIERLETAGAGRDEPEVAEGGTPLRRRRKEGGPAKKAARGRGRAALAAVAVVALGLYLTRGRDSGGARGEERPGDLAGGLDEGPAGRGTGRETFTDFLDQAERSERRRAEWPGQESAGRDAGDTRLPIQAFFHELFRILSGDGTP